MDDYDGATVLDSTGDKVGTVERTYVDDNDSIRFVEVKLGHLFGKHHLIPADQAEMTDDGLRVPFVKDMIEESPNVSGEDTLDADTLESVRAYYATSDSQVDEVDEVNPTGMAAGPVQAEPLARPSEVVEDAQETAPQPITPMVDNTDTSGQGIHAGEIRDLGDVIEVPVLQEVLVKKTVVKEVIRIRKSDMVEERIVSDDVRREDVEIESSDDSLVDGEVDTLPRHQD